MTATKDQPITRTTVQALPTAHNASQEATPGKALRYHANLIITKLLLII